MSLLPVHYLHICQKHSVVCSIQHMFSRLYNASFIDPIFGKRFGTFGDCEIRAEMGNFIK